MRTSWLIFRRLLPLCLVSILLAACGKVTTIELTSEMRKDFSIYGVTLDTKKAQVESDFEVAGEGADRVYSRDGKEIRCAFKPDGSLMSLRSDVLSFQGKALVQAGDGEKKVLALLGEPDKRLKNDGLEAFVYEGPGYQVFFEMKNKSVKEVALGTTP